jgi:spore maturation protein CgeB
MRIIVSGSLFPDSFAHNIISALEAMGHTVAHAGDPTSKVVGHVPRLVATGAMRLIPQLERWGQAGLVQAVRRHEAELVLVIDPPQPTVIAKLKRATNAKVAYWMTDHVAGFGRQYALASDYDALFFKDHFLVRFVRDKLGKPAHFLPQACNPTWHRPVELSDDDRRLYGCDLTVAGGLYYYRARMLEPLSRYDIKVWGTNCPRWLDSPMRASFPGRYVAQLEKAKAYRAAKIVFNVMHFAEIEGSNLRLFEAAGCGAFQITDRLPGIEELFEIDEELVTFATRDELHDKIAYYLAHDDEREAIAARACARAHRDHSYEVRLRELLATVMG